MLEVLLESKAVRGPRPIGGAVVSTLFHVSIVVAVVVASRTVAVAFSDDLHDLKFLLPTDRSASSPGEHLTYVSALNGNSPEGTVSDVRKKAAAQGTFALPKIVGPEFQVDRPTSIPTTSDRLEVAYSVMDVDSAATRDPSSAAPAYPIVMMNKGIEGYAAMRFVVDTSGRIDPGTIELIQATNPEFVQAVREAMPRMRFRPAKMGAVAVRQLAEQLFKFEIKKVATSVDASKKPNDLDGEA